MPYADPDFRREYNRFWRESAPGGLQAWNAQSRTYYRLHAAERREYHRTHRKANRFHERVRDNAAWLKRAYGLTVREFTNLLAQQNGRCGICGTTDWGRKRPFVDHDHTTGRLRGLLCCRCNFGVGSFKDNPDILRAAIQYLGEPPCRA